MNRDSIVTTGLRRASGKRGAESAKIGSARVARADLGVAPKSLSNHLAGSARKKSQCDTISGATPETARQRRALPQKRAGQNFAARYSFCHEPKGPQTNLAELNILQKVFPMKKPVTLGDFLIADNPKLKGKEPVYYARFRATLRIAGEDLNFEEISRTLGLEATRTGRKRGKQKVDIWLYDAPLDRTRPLDEHIMVIWKAVRPKMADLRRLKKRFKVDLICGYQSNSCTGGFNIDHRCLGLFAELDIPFGVSVIIV